MDFQQAEYNARIRDEKIKNGGLTDSEVSERMQEIQEMAVELEAITGKTVALFDANKKTKFHNDKVRFTQMIQENINHLTENKILSQSEESLLFKLTSYVHFESNALVIKKDGFFMPVSQNDLAEKINVSRMTLNKNINSLVKKGILAKSECASQNNQKIYTYFMNPLIAYNGDRRDVNQTLIMLFKKANRTVLKDLPVRFYDEQTL